jgi:hypothetical protein
MYLVGIKELQTMNDVSEASFVSSGVLRQNGGNQFLNVMYNFVETGQFPKEVRTLRYQGGFMQLLKSHVFKTAVRVVLVYLTTQTCTTCISVLVSWEKNCYTCCGSYCYAVRLPHKIYRRYTS